MLACKTRDLAVEAAAQAAFRRADDEQMRIVAAGPGFEGDTQARLDIRSKDVRNQLEEAGIPGAVPLESLIHSSRTVGGTLLTALVRALAFTLRLAGNVVRQASRVLIRLYDVAIVVPLLIERLVKAPRRSPAGPVVDMDIERTHA